MGMPGMSTSWQKVPLGCQPVSWTPGLFQPGLHCSDKKTEAGDLGDGRSLEASSLGGAGAGLSLGLGCGVKNKSPANARSSLGLAFVESSSGTLRVPGTARRSSQSPLKEVNPEYPLEGLTLKLKLQYFGHLMWRANSLEKTLMLGKIEGRRRRGRKRMTWLMASPLNGHEVEQAPGDSGGQRSLACCSLCGC